MKKWLIWLHNDRFRFLEAVDRQSALQKARALNLVITRVQEYADPRDRFAPVGTQRRLLRVKAGRKPKRRRRTKATSQ